MAAKLFQSYRKGVVYHDVMHPDKEGERKGYNCGSDESGVAGGIGLPLKRSMLSFSGSPLLCNAVLLLMGVIIFIVKQLVNFLGTGINSVLFLYHCILLLLSFSSSVGSSYLDHCYGRFCVGGWPHPSAGAV